MSMNFYLTQQYFFVVRFVVNKSYGDYVLWFVVDFRFRWWTSGQFCFSNESGLLHFGSYIFVFRLYTAPKQFGLYLFGVYLPQSSTLSTFSPLGAFSKSSAFSPSNYNNTSRSDAKSDTNSDFSRTTPAHHSLKTQIDTNSDEGNGNHVGIQP